MKKFLKIAGSICLGVLIWVVVIAGVVFLFSKQAKKNIAEMTKDMEINTTDTKDTDKDEPEITVNITKPLLLENRIFQMMITMTQCRKHY